MPRTSESVTQDAFDGVIEELKECAVRHEEVRFRMGGLELRTENPICQLKASELEIH